MSKKEQLTGLMPATRLRMEVTVFERILPSSSSPRWCFRADRKITALKVLARERFGADGERLIKDWLVNEAKDQNHHHYQGNGDPNEAA